MFELNVGTTPCDLSPRDYRALGERTEGYSGSDIAVVVRDALMQPVRKVLAATHFKAVRVPSPDDPSIILNKLTPCSPGDPDAIEKTWTDVERDELLEPPLAINDFIRAISIVRPTVSNDDIKRHVEWTQDAGADGA